MATSNKVFVSPGVYTSERDLSFVAQSVGVTTLGIVGETIKGPAFEPIFITNYDEFQAYFGGTQPEKFVGTQIPKYEAAYIAKSYLQQSNQLFVTRILGLSGYDAGPSWSITTIANVDPGTIGSNNPVATAWSVEYSGTTGSSSTITFNINGTTPFPTPILNHFGSYTTFNGGTSTVSGDIQNFIYTIAIDAIEGSGTLSQSIAFYGSIDDDDYDNLIDVDGYTPQSNVFGVNDVQIGLNDLESDTNDSWYYAMFDNLGSCNYSGSSFFNVVQNVTPIDPGLTGSEFSGIVSGSLYTYSGVSYCDYDNMVVATLRSRGLATYAGTNTGPSYYCTGATFDCTSVPTYANVNKNPYSTFAVTGSTIDNTTFSFETSLSVSQSNYLSKVFGRTNFGKEQADVPLFLEEAFPTLLNNSYNQGYIRGLNCNFVELPSARSSSSSSIAYYLDRYKSAESPWIVSQLEGTKVTKLFKAFTISDGDSSNVEVKVSILNISFNNLTFDVGVRSYSDTDSNPVYLERFVGCTMDPASNSYVGKQIGSTNGEYALLSKYIMLELNEEAPITSLPCGFEGYHFRLYNSVTSPFPTYKTAYNYPNEIIANPPFGAAFGGDNAVFSSGDKIRQTFLGFSTAFSYGWDPDYFAYKGMKNPATLCPGTAEAEPWNYLSKGFHMDSGATVVTIPAIYSTSGTSMFDVGAASFQSDPTNPNDPYYTIQSRKFTFLVQGGFDGWDIYTRKRTNTDRFIIGGSGWANGACDILGRYPSASETGMFKNIVIEQDVTNWSTTDYYAYLLGIYTFNNPESVNINVLVTPGIDYFNNSNLVESAISMVQEDRADSLYICTTPDVDVNLPVVTVDDIIYPTQAVDNLDQTGIDSNYTATYYPWILVRDTVNNTQIYIPPTGEVTRNLALTDNIAFPWFASAGYTRGLVNSIKARLKLTQPQRDTLYEGRINPIATFADVGTVIWGNKTLQVKQSALDRINVRRLLLQTRKLISAVAARLLFEQNDEKVRQDFLNSVNPILDAIRRDRGLYDFRVTVSSDPADLDRNQLVGKIYLKPTKSLEFIDIEFLITPTGASFEDI